MFQNINGVQFREVEETKFLPDLKEKRFEIEYIDNVYLHKRISLDLININVTGQKRKFGIKLKADIGRKWMLVVKDTDFEENRSKYAELGCIIHDKIGPFLIEEFGYVPGDLIMDQADKVYVR